MKVCAWCGKRLDPLSDERGPPTHGICDQCAEDLELTRVDLQDLLDEMLGPVVVVDADNAVAGANSLAREKYGARGRRLRGLGIGEVLKCVYADLPGGCGTTTHCDGCTIRRAVVRTLSTGVPVHDVGYHVFKDEAGGRHRVWREVFTRKAGDLVVLKVVEGKKRENWVVPREASDAAHE
ncbi:MAG: hypothetical protein Kow0069_35280 [Promethearchaeota archaeon]